MAAAPCVPPKASYGFVTIHPTFTIINKDKAKPIMADFVKKTKSEKGCIYYGWTVCGDKLYCREAYVDGAAVNEHLKNVGSCIGAILADGICKLDSIEIHGPAKELEVCKPGTKDLGTAYFEVDSGFTNINSATGSDFTPYSFVEIQPTFTVLDKAKAKPIMADFVKKTKSEGGCVYYGWTVSGDKLFCREAYVDGAAVNAHLKNVGSCISAILADGVCKLDSIRIHGPAKELEVCKPGTKDLGTAYYEVDSGFSRFK